MTVEGHLQISGNTGWCRLLAASFLLAMAPGAAMAQQVGNPATLAPPEEVEEIRRYTVELIVFEYNASSAADTEIFAPDIVPMEDELLAEFPAQYPADVETAIRRNMFSTMYMTNWSRSTLTNRWYAPRGRRKPLRKT